MRIESLRLQNFRNYPLQELSFSPDVNVICGENAQGKTNLLEAMVYLSCGKSPRARTDKELIRFGEGEARVQAKVLAREREFSLDVQLFEGKRRKISINKVTAKKASELSSVLGTVYFCPEDLFLIREGAAARRKFMDTALCSLRPRYAEALAEYNRLYEHKTRILRDSEEHPDLLLTLPDFNLRMAQFGAVLIHYRARFCERLAQYAAAAHAECSGGREELTLCYETVKTVLDPFASQEELFHRLMEHQNAHDAAERASRLCLSGPHKDDICVSIGGRSARGFASQGQTRTAALAFKLAEREIYKEITGETPVLLLDDVLSELDPKRQEFVLNRISGGQVFITCCEEDRLGTLLGGKVLRIKEGSVV
ncbi:MAG: DNA replication/repair protein RecF [Oscillospiraceae bacterium]|jgi:DNA replication and repair protein RecF|nr:DNA replication/repair protein RecF [Oscillospiraceae bacterium]